MRFSICIPAYEMRGKGVPFLEELLESLSRQTFKDFEVIVSDHSRDGRIRELCQKWTEKNIFILRYFHYDEYRGDVEANRNNAVRQAMGEIIKPIDQDDILYDKDCVHKIDATMKNHPQLHWGITGYIYMDEYGKKISTLTKNSVPISTVFYVRLGGKSSLTVNHNDPYVIREPLVAVRLWPFQAGRYRRLNQLSFKERQSMLWISSKQTVRKYILNPLDKFLKKI